LRRRRGREHAQPQHGEAQQHLHEEPFRVRRVRLRQRGQRGRVAVVEHAALGLRGERDESRFQILHVRLVQVLVLAREDDAVRPEVFLRRVLLQAGPDRVALADVHARQTRILGRADQHVYAGARQFPPLLGLAK